MSLASLLSLAAVRHPSPAFLAQQRHAGPLDGVIGRGNHTALCFEPQFVILFKPPPSLASFSWGPQRRLIEASGRHTTLCRWMEIQKHV